MAESTRVINDLPNNKGKLGLGWHEELAGSLGLLAHAHLILLSRAVLLDILLGALEHNLAAGALGLDVRE